MKSFTRKGPRGFTIVEMLVALSVLAILIAFGSPMLENTSARSEMKEATDQMAQAFRTAKTAARINNSSVTITLTTTDSANTVSFAFSNGTNISDSGQSLPIVRLPFKVAVSADTDEFIYNALGMINDTGTIALASTTNGIYASKVEITSLMGHVATSYDAHGESES